MDIVQWLPSDCRTRGITGTQLDETWMSGDTRGWKLYQEAVWRTPPQHLNSLVDTVEPHGGLLVSQFMGDAS